YQSLSQADGQVILRVGILWRLAGVVAGWSRLSSPFFIFCFFDFGGGGGGRSKAARTESAGCLRARHLITTRRYHLHEYTRERKKKFVWQKTTIHLRKKSFSPNPFTAPKPNSHW